MDMTMVKFVRGVSASPSSPELLTFVPNKRLIAPMAARAAWDLLRLVIPARGIERLV
jgi:hypothetical protein